MQEYGKFSPIILEGLPDWKKDSSKWLDWRKEQLNYFDKGYEVGGDRITGEHYFFLNFYKLEKALAAGKGKQIIAPQYMDVDDRFFKLFEWCQINGWNMTVKKGREKGLSEWAASISIQKTQTLEGANIITLFPGGENPAIVNFRRKYKLAHSHLPEIFKHNPINGGSDEKREYYYIDENLETKETKIRGIQSSISFTRAVDKNVTKSGRNAFIFGDEAGEMKDPLGLVMAAQSNMNAGSERTGVILLGGTSNTNNAGYEQFRDLCERGESLRYKNFTIYAYQKRRPYISFPDGRSLEEEARAEIEAEAKEIKKISNVALLQYWQDNPIEEAHFFLSTKSEVLNQANIAEQLAAIEAHSYLKDSIQRGNIIGRTGANEELITEWEMDEDGRWERYLPPMQDINAVTGFSKDIIGMDGVIQNVATSSGSKNAIVVYRQWVNANTSDDCQEVPVCVYYHRYNEEGGKERWYQDLILTAHYYKGKIQGENCDPELLQYFKQKGLLKYVWNRPPSTDSPYAKPNVNDFLIPASSSGAFNNATQLLKSYVDLHFRKIRFSSMLKDMAKFGLKRNDSDSDISDAFKWALVQANANITYRPNEEVKKKKTSNTPYYDGGGWQNID